MARVGAPVKPFLPVGGRRSTNDVIWKRTDVQTINASSSTLTYSPTSGAWTTTTLSRDSCTSQAESTITFNSSVSFTFVGTSLSVNIIKDTTGAPYKVTVDGNVNSYDSYATSQECTADFQASNMPAKEHTVVVAHNGNSSLTASGRSTLYFVSFDYTPSGSTQPGGSSSPPVGAIIGGVVAGLAVVGLCGFLWWFLRRRKARAEEGKEAIVAYEPFESTYVIPQDVPHDNDGRPIQDNDGRPSLHPPNVQQQRRPWTKGAEAATNSRYVRTSHWASLTSNNHSRPNMAGGSGLSGSEEHSSSLSQSDSLRPTSIAHSQRTSPIPAVMQPLLQTTNTQSSRHYAPPPSTVGESVLIDDPDYVAPPSYSPPPSNHPRLSGPRGVQGKAIYEGTDDSSGSTNWLSPNSTHLALPSGAPSTSQAGSQTLSPADIDVIARRVADIMRSPSSTTGSRLSEVSSVDASNPQVQQAVRVILAKENPQTTPVPPNPPNTGE